MLKLIPNEPAAATSDASQKCASPFKKQRNRKKKGKTVFFTLPPKMQQKLAAEIGAEKKMLQTVCVKFIKFIKNAEAKTEQEIEELIHGLQKSVLTLQKQRQKMSWRKKK